MFPHNLGEKKSRDIKTLLFIISDWNQCFSIIMGECVCGRVGWGCEMLFGSEEIGKVFLGAQVPWSAAAAATWALGSAEAPEVE